MILMRLRDNLRKLEGGFGHTIKCSLLGKFWMNVDSLTWALSAQILLGINTTCVHSVGTT